MAKPILSQEYLKQLFDYKDGHLYWKVILSYRVQIGRKTGFMNSNGYLQTCINKTTYLNHRLIYIWHHGYEPKYIDHIDNIRTNNKIENLREITIADNCKNGKLRINNKSGIKNVSWYKRDGKWKVELRVNNKLKSFGTFDDLELAELVAKEARNKYYGAYSRDK